MRDADVIQAFQQGAAIFDWWPLVIEDMGHRLVVSVMRDAPKVGGVRICASGRATQVVADMVGGMLSTARIEDRIHEAADVRLDAIIRVGGQIVADVSSERYSAAIDDIVGDSPGLVSSVCKPWVLSAAYDDEPGTLLHGINTVFNYGWHHEGGPYAATLPGLNVWQPLAKHGAHIDTYGERDPSQAPRIILVQANLDGSPVDIRAVLRDRSLAPLISHQGAFRAVRLPSVEQQPATNGVNT